MTKFSDDPGVSAVLAKFPGSEIVDVRHASPADGENVTPAVGYSLAELAKAARAESDRIILTQDALVLNGDRVAPHAGELERARKFEAIQRNLDRVRNDKQIVDRLKELAGTK